MIRSTIDKVANFASELDFIDYEIILLSGLAGAIIENDVQDIDMILETLPNSGVRPILRSMYAAPPLPPPGSFLMLEPPDENQKSPLSLGFQRLYNPAELKDTEGMVTIQLELEHTLAAAVIDTLIKRLKRRKTQIIKDTDQIIKKKPKSSR